MNPEEPPIEEQPTEPAAEPVPVPVEYEYEGFADPTPSDIVDKDDILIFLQQKQIESLKEQKEQDKLLLDSVNEKLQTLVTQGSEGDSTLSDVNEQIVTKLDTLIQQQSDITVGSNTIVTYGVLYIPLIIICFLLWRFFATFLRNAR